MKHVQLFLAALILSAGLSTALKAAEGGDAKAGEWTGTVACAHCAYEKVTKAEGCSAAIKVGETVYFLKASDKADDATKAKIKDYKKDLKGDYTVKGTQAEADGKKWIIADSLSAKEESKPK